MKLKKSSLRNRRASTKGTNQTTNIPTSLTDSKNKNPNRPLDQTITRLSYPRRYSSYQSKLRKSFGTRQTKIPSQNSEWGDLKPEKNESDIFMDQNQMEKESSQKSPNSIKRSLNNTLLMAFYRTVRDQHLKFIEIPNASAYLSLLFEICLCFCFHSQSYLNTLLRELIIQNAVIIQYIFLITIILFMVCFIFQIFYYKYFKYSKWGEERIIQRLKNSLCWYTAICIYYYSIPLQYQRRVILLILNRNYGGEFTSKNYGEDAEIQVQWSKSSFLMLYRLNF